MKKVLMQFQPKKLTRKQAKRVWIMLLAKLGFAQMTPTVKVSTARHIVDAMTGNPNFTTPNPSLASVTAAADALEAAQAALDGTLIKTYDRNTAQTALNT